MSEDLKSLLNEQRATIKKLEEFVSLYLRKDKIMPELKALESQAEEVKELVYECNKYKEDFQEKMFENLKNLQTEIKLRQFTVLNIIEELNKRKAAIGTAVPGTSQQSLTVQMAESTPIPIQRYGIKKTVETPRMYVSDYEKSPYIAKVRPVTLQFIDFEADIPAESFDAIPKYMRGRVTLDELNQFLDNIIISCFTEKYQLMHKKREALRNTNDIDIWKLYRHQAPYYPGLKFITQEDIVRKTAKPVDKKSLGKIAMLRHLGVLREDRKNALVFYIWNS